jgi:predicted nucleotidyltransferase
MCCCCSGLSEAVSNKRNIKFRYNIDMSKVRIKVPTTRIADFCKRWNVSEFALFGSALSTEFHRDSDVDIMVSFNPDASVSLFDMVKMQDELKHIFGRDVDLVTRSGVENSRNYLRRKAILDSAQVIHVPR